MKFRKLFYSVIHTKRSQLSARLWLMIKRRLSELFSGYRNERFNKREIDFTVRNTLPGPVFEPRNNFFKVMKGERRTFSLTFLNHTRDFCFPINWHDKALEKGTRLWKLNLHYMEYLEEVDNEWFGLLINSWINKNIPYKKGYYLDSWNAYALSIRVVVWMQQLKVRKSELDKHFFNKACRSLYRQLLFLEKNIEKDIRGNHIIKNIKALIWASRFFENGHRVKQWQKMGMKLLQQELEEQVLSDGMHFERSPSYHNQVLADLLECYHVLPGGSLKQELQHTLSRMGRVTQSLKHPDGLPGLFNDGGLTMAYAPDELLQVLQTDISFSGLPDKKIYLPAAGYYGFCKNKSYLLCDAGKIAPDYLPAHGHGDIFSFEWTIENRRMFIDKGVYEYNAGPKRKASRSTLSHNTVNIAQKDQCEFWGAFRVARRAKITIMEERIDEKGFFLRASHDGYKRLNGKPIHGRTFRFNGQNLEIVDFIEKGNRQQAEARFLLHPDVEVTKAQDKLLLTRGSVCLEFISSGTPKIINSVWYPNFGVEEPCKQIVVRLGTIPCEATHKITRLE